MVPSAKRVRLLTSAATGCGRFLRAVKYPGERTPRDLAGADALILFSGAGLPAVNRAVQSEQSERNSILAVPVDVQELDVGRAEFGQRGG